MKPQSTSFRNSLLRLATMTSLASASLLLTAACQDNTDPSEATATEEALPLEAIGDVDVATMDIDTRDVGVTEGASPARAERCEVRCSNGDLHHGFTDSKSDCLRLARSWCGPGHVKRVKFAGVYR